MAEFEKGLAVYGFLNFLITACVTAVAKVLNLSTVLEATSLWLAYNTPFTLYSVFYIIAKTGGEHEERH